MNLFNFKSVETILLFVGVCFFVGGLLLRFLFYPDYKSGIIVGALLIIVSGILWIKKRKK